MIASLQEDTVLRERYRLTNIVGQGGMGSIYRAEDIRLPGRLCAIKEIQPDPSLSPEMQAQEQAQFLQEASILAQLDHPNLPKVSDYFSEDGREYLVMDYIPGQDLKQLLDGNDGPFDEKTVLAWGEQIINALAYLHWQDPPVLHRDIKPANIKFTPDNRIKLVDFGLVKLMAPDDLRTITVVQGRGTALYTPLEQYGGDSGHTDARTDIYALGATLYHLLSDFPPPDAKARFLNPRALKPLERVNQDIQPHVAEAIDWAMEMHPDERPSSISQFEQALTGKISRANNGSGETIQSTLLQALRTNLPIILIAFALFILAIALTIF
ncbi:MAG: serine/threonine protein kinase [Chloroflexi bacterium]|nr:serine/threonine protein kinase [Chloroflexota bacterium]